MYNKKYYDENKESINKTRRAKYIKKYKITDEIINKIKEMYDMDVKIKTICKSTSLSYYHVRGIITNIYPN